MFTPREGGGESKKDESTSKKNERINSNQPRKSYLSLGFKTAYTVLPNLFLFYQLFCSKEDPLQAQRVRG